MKDIMKMTIIPRMQKREVELLRQQLAKANRAYEELACLLAKSHKNPPARPKKKSTRRMQMAAIETATVQTKAEARTVPVMHQAAIATGETQRQANEVPGPQGLR